MTDFLDTYLPDAIRGFPWTASPRFSTTITAVANGHEHRNRNWKHPLHRFTAPEAVKCMEDVEDLKDHWMVCGGPLLSFPIRDPMDFASCRLSKPNKEPVPVFTDCVLGIGDGITRDFQLVKTYTRGGSTYARKITLPLTESVIVAGNALALATADPVLPGGPYTFDVTREGGIVTFDHAPHTGVIITAGFLFDVPVRFESDDAFDGIVKAFEVSGFADLSFVEVRPCAEGQSE